MTDCMTELTGVLEAQSDEWCAGARRPILPYGVNEVVFHRHQAMACTGQGLGHVLPLI